MNAPRSAALLLALLLAAGCGGGDRSFSSARWKALREAGNSGRRMVALAEGLVRGGEARGLTPSEVLELLGEDDGATGRGPPGELEWVLEEGFLSCTVLRVNFGADHKVSEVFTVHITY